MTKKIVLIDGHALIHRAFHALPPTLSSPKGVPTNAVYGFTTVLMKMIKDLKPDYIAATFDLAAPTFRHEEFTQYKAHREKAPDELHAQTPIIKEILGTFGIPIYEKPGFEADDVIGALSEKAKKEKDLQVVIMTGDLDTLQLVEDKKVVVFTLRKGVTDTMTYDQEEVKKRYGLEPAQLNDFKGLKGDPSDNIPGVPGIGEKTAATLIQKFGSIENLYQSLGKQKTALSEKLVQKLLENKDMAFFSKKLATIIRDVDVDFNLEKADWRKNLNIDALTAIFKEYGLYSLIKRVGEIASPVQAGLGLGESTQEPAKSGLAVKEYKDKKSILGFFNEVIKEKKLVFFIHEDTLYVLDDAGSSVSVPFSIINGEKETLSIFKRVFEDDKVLKTGYDFKETAKFLVSYGIEAAGLEFDVKIAAYLLNPDQKDYGIGKVYFDEFHEDIDTHPAAYPAVIERLSKALGRRLKQNDLEEVFTTIELPLEKVLAEMELRGVRINIKSLAKLSKAVDIDISKLEKKIFKIAGTKFNINSPAQLGEILFNPAPAGLGLKGKVKKTGTGALSTAAAELEKLIGEHPIIDLILKYREVQKLKTTYIEPFPGLISKHTGRLHTTFNQTGTATGRLSSQDPNLQNIPTRTELGQEFRKSFIASPGYQLLSFDYSQLELRIAAHISQDKKMIGAFKRGEDIHTRTAAEVFNVPADKVDKNMRRDAKVLNFGILYGMGVLGFQRASGVSRERARGFIDRYFEEFSGVADYMQEMRLRAHRDGFVTTLFGRKRYVPEAKSNIPQLVSQAERVAINMPIQGTAADLMKLAMIEIFSAIHKTHRENDIMILLQVHDELLFEVKKDKIKDAAVEIKSIMENIYKLRVPLTVDVKYGDNWAQLKPI